MKYLFLTVLFYSLTFSHQLSGQRAEWAPFGTEWYYDQIEFGPPENNYNKLVVIGDTTIDGILCSQIKWELVEDDIYQRENIYTYEEDGKVYFYQDQWYLVYDWDAGVGDTISTSYIFGNLSYRIDSIAEMEVTPGDTVNCQFINYLPDSKFYFGEFIIIGIGADQWILPNNSAQDPPDGGLIRCYVERGEKLIGSRYECDYLNHIGDLIEEFSVYPNPFQSRINIDHPDEFEVIGVYNAIGLELPFAATQISDNEVEVSLESDLSGMIAILIQFQDRIQLFQAIKL